MQRWQDDGGREYRASDRLYAAVECALDLGMPLLVTGEPGVGKTQLAFFVAHQLGLGAERVYRFNARSTTEYRDLFYTFDEVRYFRASQRSAEEPDPRGFLRFHALGKSIIGSLGYQEPRQFLHQEPPEEPFRSVVLIDEIDKAPRDFPNDLLAAFEQFSFEIPELEGVLEDCRVSASPAAPPIVILTSNSESVLPKPFLRRCAYFHIEFPTRAQLKEIVAARVERSQDLEWALDLFFKLRSLKLVKPPSTGELKQWLSVLNREAWSWEPESLAQSLPLLIKTEEDRERAEACVRRFGEERS